MQHHLKLVEELRPGVEKGCQVVVRRGTKAPSAAVSSANDLGCKQFSSHHCGNGNAFALEIWAIRNTGRDVNLAFAHIETEAKGKAFLGLLWAQEDPTKALGRPRLALEGPRRPRKL